jgi:catechol 2,3-dioxygenase-like lactoylglutathione lyase family enzyme
MLDHVSITVSDFAAAVRFYDAIMKALEIVKVEAVCHRAV